MCRRKCVAGPALSLIHDRQQLRCKVFLRVIVVTKGAVVHDMGEVVIVGRTLGNEFFKNLNEQNDAT